MSQKRGSSGNNFIFIIFGSFIVILVAVLSAFILNHYISQTESEDVPKSEELAEDEVKRLKYWGVAIEKWHEAGHLRTMDRTFKALGYKFVDPNEGDDWNILWSIEHAQGENFRKNFMPIWTNKLRLDQKINHFPGIPPLVSKSHMNEANQHLPYILPSFKLPKDKDRLKKFLEENPKKKLVQKDFYNGNVGIIDAQDIIYEESDIFYQQFLDKPFLVDGHAFDFGVFVLITSFDPIRIYRYDADVLFRFCNKSYQPFDQEDTDRYVVQEGSIPPNDMPMFKKNYQTYKYPFRQIFENHIKEKGFDVKELWRKIDDAIVKIILNVEHRVNRYSEEDTSRGWTNMNFFELVRFDFMFDENLDPFVMEVNMSPNLTPAEEIYEENVIIYEQMIMNVLKMIGFGSVADFSVRLNDSDIAVANRKNIAVDIENCLKYECDKNCAKQRCQTCLPCLSDETRFQLREAFREHSYEANFRRVFPKSQHFEDEKLLKSMSKINKISIAWFNAKCREDKKWC